MTVNEASSDTPIPDTLRSQRVNQCDYSLRLNTSITLDSKLYILRALNGQGVADTCLYWQNILNETQECYGRIATTNQFLHSDYNVLSNRQLQNLLKLWFQYCDTRPEICCCEWYARGRPCQCLAIYKASGGLPSP